MGVLHNLEAQDKLCKSFIKFLIGLLSRRASCPEMLTVVARINVLYLAKKELLSGALKGVELAKCSVSLQSNLLTAPRNLYSVPHSGYICFKL